MERLAVAVAIVAAALVVAFVVNRRRPDVPTQPQQWSVPAQLDRSDFEGRDRDWLVVVFTSATCASCAETTTKARVLESRTVAFQEVSWQDRRDLHERYAVEVVPALVIADAEGVVRASFIGTPTATDLWAAAAEARIPGSSPEPYLGQGAVEGGE